MQQTLDRDDISSEDKARLYQQTLQHHMHCFEQHRNRPIGVVDIKSPPSPSPPIKVEEVHKEPAIEKTSILHIPRSRENVECLRNWRHCQEIKDIVTNQNMKTELLHFLSIRILWKCLPKKKKH